MLYINAQLTLQFYLEILHVIQQSILIHDIFTSVHLLRPNLGKTQNLSLKNLTLVHYLVESRKVLGKTMIQLTCTQRFLINILKQGHVPEHISFIMDGNRRYAVSKNKESYKGHQQGKQSLKKCLLYCLQLGVKQTSFYCFSIQNFKRSEIQINKLMELVLNTFDQLSEVSEFVLKKNVKVNVVGKTQLLRKDVGQCLRGVEQKTRNNSKMIVNLCFAYDSLDQINTAIDNCKEQAKSQDVTYKDVYSKLMIRRPIDILVRTSNESRLSNFMLMQNGYSLVYILKQNWPQINLYSLGKIIFNYNYNYKSVQKKKLVWLRKFNIEQSLGLDQGQELDKGQNYSLILEDKRLL